MEQPTQLAEVGGSVDEASLTVVIRGLDLDPQEVTALLACAPSEGARRGDARPKGPPLTHGIWKLRVEARSPHGPEDLVKELLARVPADPALWAQLRARYQVTVGFGVFIKGWHQGFELSHSSLMGLAALGAGLGCGIYADDGAAEDQLIS